MEPTNNTSLILKFRSLNSFGIDALKNYDSKKIKRHLFLVRAIYALKALFENEAPIVHKYTEIIKHEVAHDISKEHLTGLLQEVQGILANLEQISEQGFSEPKSRASQPPVGKKVFIIHGQDELNTRRLRDLLRDHFLLDPVLMKEDAGRGRALLEKYEDTASPCSMAFAILTCDDKITNLEATYFQARPNVIFEAGWFVGRLGISRVCLLTKEGIRVHSDIEGISRIPFNNSIEEKVLEITKELQASGMLNI